MPDEKITLQIPKALHDHIMGLIKESGFESVNDFVVHVLRDVVYDSQEKDHEALTPYELRRIKNKLHLLGYL
jgi:hypothetical protein